MAERWVSADMQIDISDEHDHASRYSALEGAIVSAAHGQSALLVRNGRPVAKIVPAAVKSVLSGPDGTTLEY